VGVIERLRATTGQHLLKTVRHRVADAQRKCFGLPRPTPPRFRARIPVTSCTKVNERYAEPEQSNALRVPSEPLLPPFLCC
jgi:hypothetical protein